MINRTFFEELVQAPEPHQTTVFDQFCGNSERKRRKTVAAKKVY
jgi:hypothetical protein